MPDSELALRVIDISDRRLRPLPARRRADDERRRGARTTCASSSTPTPGSTLDLRLQHVTAINAEARGLRLGLRVPAGRRRHAARAAAVHRPDAEAREVDGAQLGESGRGPSAFAAVDRAKQPGGCAGGCRSSPVQNVHPELRGGALVTRDRCGGLCSTAALTRSRRRRAPRTLPPCSASNGIRAGRPRTTTSSFAITSRTRKLRTGSLVRDLAMPTRACRGSGIARTRGR